TSFYGNEMVVGAILASWMFWVGVGSWLGAKTIRNLKDKSIFFSNLLLAYSLILFVVYIIAKEIIHLTPTLLGQITNFETFFLATFLITAPLSFPVGIFFVAGSAVYGSDRYEKKHIAKIYYLESSGAVFGGFLFTFVFVFYLSHYSIIILCSLMLLLSHLVLEKLVRGRLSLAGVIFLVLVFVAIFSTGKMEKMLDDFKWKPRNLVVSKNTPFGNIAVTEKEGDFSFYYNGLFMASTKDKLLSEEAVHYPLLQHKNPAKVLIIGGVSSGIITEVLKYPVEEVFYVDLDPYLVDLSKKYLLSRDKKPLQDRRVKLIIRDGRDYIKRTEKKFDIILIFLPDPYNAQLNRFYSLEFFKEAKNALSKDGVFSISISSGEDYMGSDKRNYNAAIWTTFQKAFNEMTFVPGENLFLIGKNEGEHALVEDKKEIIKIFSKKNINSQYINSAYLAYKYEKERRNYFKKQIEKERAKINRDYVPISYYYDAVLWSSWQGGASQSILKFLKNIPFKYFSLFIFTFLFIIIYFKRQKSEFAPLYTLGVSGFVMISVEFILLLWFQLLYGYMYFQIGLIISLFMAGITFGAFFANRLIEKKNISENMLMYLQVAEALLLLLFLFILCLFPNLQNTVFLGYAAIYLLILATGILEGFEFPVALTIIKGRHLKENVAGRAYGSDLFGACLGGFIVSGALVPLYGFINTILILAGLSLTSVVSLYFSLKT
ncbi:MAG: hypothetical protein KAS39_02210, partial [Actinomycetia bacterium]|nr:hypothetical protein [Actinomycetes bacterium]